MEKDEAGRIGALRAREGRVHSMETMGTVDGPGTRLVVFCQGCPMRCAYCHNPDSWDPAAGSVTTAGRIHTCLDTSGIAFSAASPERHAALLDECDLVLLDVKHAFDEGHRELTGKAAGNPRALGDELARRGTPVVVRHVVVPGITDDPEELAALGRLIARWDNVVGLDLLPYHTMGVGKYRALGLDYPLEGVSAQEKGAIPGLRRQVLEARAAARSDRG